VMGRLKIVPDALEVRSANIRASSHHLRAMRHGTVRQAPKHWHAERGGDWQRGTVPSCCVTLTPLGVAARARTRPPLEDRLIA
jgi:hypothetical protein